MSKPLAFFLMLVIVVAGQMIALSIHLKKKPKCYCFPFWE